MIVAFTGAGISKESGIDTFQDRPGIRDKLTRTYACRHPEKYREVMREFVEMVQDKEPNDAHIALAEYDIPVITMNIDKLHTKAGTKHLIELHGRLPNEDELGHCDRLYNVPVLYEDPAPKYQEGYDLVWLMDCRDILLVIGASTYTNVSSLLRQNVRLQGGKVVEIQNNASVEVRKFLESHKEYMESYEDFMKRMDDM